MKKLSISLFVICLTLLMVGCSGISVPPTNWNEIEIKDFSWQPFEWRDSMLGETYYDKAAIFVPIQLEQSDREFWLQLDTAAPSLFFGSTIDSLELYGNTFSKNAKNDAIIFNGKIAGYDTKNAIFATMKNYGQTVTDEDEDVRIGSLGMDFFKDRILVLDFPNNRLAIANSASQLPAEIVEKVTFSKSEMVRNYFVVNMMFGETPLKIAYDTGSSIFPLHVNQDLWQQFTGREGKETDNIFIEAPAWGNYITVIGAPSKEEMIISDFELGKPMIYYSEKTPDRYKGSGLDGLMGNAPFFDDYIVILDGIEQRFGLVKVH